MIKLDLKVSDGSKLPFHTLASLKDRLGWLINLRWMSVLFILFCVPVSQEMLNFEIGFNQITNLALILLSVNVLFFFINSYLPFSDEYQELAFAEIQILFDLIVISFLIHFSGGIGNPFYFLYIVQVILSGILFPGKILPYFNAFVAAALLTSWTVLEHFVLVNRYLLRTEPISSSLIITSLAAFYITNFAGIYIINNFMISYRSLKKLIDMKNSQLERAMKDRSRAFRFAAHELKSPVTAIQSTLDVIKSLYINELRSEVRDMVCRAERRSAQLIDMIKEMITLTHYNLGIEKPVFSSVSFNDWLSNVVSTFSILADHKDITLIYHPLSVELLVSIDITGMEKVASNLLSNALRYTKPGGSVEIYPFVSEESFGFCVRDTGIGIPENELQMIFEEFYRSRNARETELIGTGLGLNLVREIVELHHGSIEVISSLGKGSEFKVRFPFTTPTLDEKPVNDMELNKS